MLFRSALREVGFDQPTVAQALIMVIQIQVNGANATPGNDGISGGIDVEHLLIRTYIRHIGVNVRNIQKVGPFQNSTGELLRWSLVNNAGIDGFGGPYDYTLANGATL